MAWRLLLLSCVLFEFDADAVAAAATDASISMFEFKSSLEEMLFNLLMRACCAETYQQMQCGGRLPFVAIRSRWNVNRNELNFHFNQNRGTHDVDVVLHLPFCRKIALLRRLAGATIYSFCASKSLSNWIRCPSKRERESVRERTDA